MRAQALLQKMVHTLGTYIHDVNKKQLVEAIKSIKMDMEYDSQMSAELLNAIFRFPDAVHKIIISTATIQPHWMFALDSLLRTAVQAAVTVLEPDVGANLENSMAMATATPASSGGVIFANAPANYAYISGRAGNGNASMTTPLQTHALERRSTLSPADEGDDEVGASADGSDPVMISDGAGGDDPRLDLPPIGRSIAMSFSGRYDDVPSPDRVSESLDLSADSSQQLQQQPPPQQQAQQAVPVALPYHLISPGPAAPAVARDRSGSFNTRRRPAPSPAITGPLDPVAHVQSPLVTSSSLREESPPTPVLPALHHSSSVSVSLAHAAAAAAASVSVASASAIGAAAAGAGAGAGAAGAVLPLPEEHSTSGVSTLDSNHSGTDF